MQTMVDICYLKLRPGTKDFQQYYNQFPILLTLELLFSIVGVHPSVPCRARNGATFSPRLFAGRMFLL